MLNVPLSTARPCASLIMAADLSPKHKRGLLFSSLAFALRAFKQQASATITAFAGRTDLSRRRGEMRRERASGRWRRGGGGTGSLQPPFVAADVWL